MERYIDRRQIARHQEEMIGEVGQNFSYNRQALLDSVGRSAREVVGGYNRDAESRRLAEELRQTFGTTAFVGLGGVGIGGVLVYLLTGAAMDVTGILLGTAIVFGGLYLIPAKRREAKIELSKKIQGLREQLGSGITRQVHAAISDSTNRINESIAPYRRFIQTQQEQLNEARGELVAAEDALLRLKTEIDGSR